MTDRLLDTNAVSAAMQDHSRLAHYLAMLESESSLFLSAVVEGEIRFGIARLARGTKRTRLLNVFSQILATFHEVLPVTRATAHVYSRIKAQTFIAGKPLSDNDLWIAASALEHELVLVTGDAAFRAVPGLAVEDWRQR